MINHEPVAFRRLKSPTTEELAQLIHTISGRIGRHLERAGLLIRDIENSYLDLEPMDDSMMDDLVGHSVSYRIAIGPNTGRKAFTLQTIPARDNDFGCGLAKASGFSCMRVLRPGQNLYLRSISRFAFIVAAKSR